LATSWQPSQSIAAELELEPAAAKKAARCHARAAFFLWRAGQFGSSRILCKHGVDDGTAGRLLTTKRAAALTTTAIIPEPHNYKIPEGLSVAMQPDPALKKR
jgi:hypothetical protein